MSVEKYTPKTCQNHSRTKGLCLKIRTVRSHLLVISCGASDSEGQHRWPATHRDWRGRGRGRRPGPPAERSAAVVPPAPLPWPALPALRTGSPVTGGCSGGTRALNGVCWSFTKRLFTIWCNMLPVEKSAHYAPFCILIRTLLWCKNTLMTL